MFIWEDFFEQILYVLHFFRFVSIVSWGNYWKKNIFFYIFIIEKIFVGVEENRGVHLLEFLQLFSSKTLLKILEFFF